MVVLPCRLLEPVSLKHDETDGTYRTVKMASLPVPSVSDIRDRQMGHADRTLKMYHLEQADGTMEKVCFSVL